MPAPGVVLAVMGGVWLLLAQMIDGLTQDGADLQARWQGFGKAIDKLTAADVAPGTFARLLPYAAAVGGDVRLLKTATAGGDHAPAWFQGNDAAGVVSLASCQRMMVAVIASTASSSGTSAGGGGGGGGGASGGGGGGAG